MSRDASTHFSFRFVFFLTSSCKSCNLTTVSQQKKRQRLIPLITIKVSARTRDLARLLAARTGKPMYIEVEQAMERAMSRSLMDETTEKVEGQVQR